MDSAAAGDDRKQRYVHSVRRLPGNSQANIADRMLFAFCLQTRCSSLIKVPRSIDEPTGMSKHRTHVAAFQSPCDFEQANLKFIETLWITTNTLKGRLKIKV